MRAIYLMGTNVYLRAMIESDKECGIAWFNSGLPLSGFGNHYPINAAHAETVLKDENSGAWAMGGNRRYAIVRNDGDEVVGSFVEEANYPTIARIGLHMAPMLADADRLQAEALRLVIPWLRDERQFRLVQIYLPADQSETIAAAATLDMTEVVRLRRHVARPSERVDLVMYEAVNARWAGVHA